MDKYAQAVMDYAFWNSEIKRLKKAIIEASMVPCSNIEKELTVESYIPSFSGGDKTSTCIERLWEYNKYMFDNDEDQEDPDEAPELCKSCSEVQKLVDEMKAARGRFGVEKRRISAFGRALFKQTESK